MHSLRCANSKRVLQNITANWNISNEKTKPLNKVKLLVRHLSYHQAPMHTTPDNQYKPEGAVAAGPWNKQFSSKAALKIRY